MPAYCSRPKGAKSSAQLAYEADVLQMSTYRDTRETRPTWQELDPGARNSWEYMVSVWAKEASL